MRSFILEFLIYIFVIGVRSEVFEFHLSGTHPMLTSSLRAFEQVRDDFYVFKAQNGSVLLKTDDGFGLMGVVQLMNLQDKLEPQECIDYIKMSQGSGNESTSNICGSVKLGPDDLANSFATAKQSSFMDKSGFIQLDYFVGDKNRLSDPEENITNFNISFTPFTECPESAFPFGNGELKPCSMVDTFSCISASYFCDGIVNCGFPHEFGLDELNCPGPDESSEEESGLEIDENVLENDHEADFKLHILKVDAKIRNRSKNINALVHKIGLGMNSSIIAALTILLLLLAVIKMSSNDSSAMRRTRSVFSISRIRSYNNNAYLAASTAEKSSSVLIENPAFNPETDPSPSYEDCLLDPRPVYCELSYEMEKPPTYDEVRVHSLKRY